MHMCDKEVLCKLLQDHECSDISESESSSESNMNVKISSTSGQSFISDDEDNSVTSSMVHRERHWMATFSVDLEENPSVYSELLITPEIAKLVNRETVTPNSFFFKHS